MGQIHNVVGSHTDLVFILVWCQALNNMKGYGCNEHEKLSNITIKNKLLVVKVWCSIFHSHSRVVSNEHNSYPKWVWNGSLPAVEWYIWATLSFCCYLVYNFISQILVYQQNMNVMCKRFPGIYRYLLFPLWIWYITNIGWHDFPLKLQWIKKYLISPIGVLMLSNLSIYSSYP